MDLAHKNMSLNLNEIAILLNKMLPNLQNQGLPPACRSFQTSRAESNNFSQEVILHQTLAHVIAAQSHAVAGDSNCQPCRSLESTSVLENSQVRRQSLRALVPCARALLLSIGCFLSCRIHHSSNPEASLRSAPSPLHCG